MLNFTVRILLICVLGIGFASAGSAIAPQASAQGDDLGDDDGDGTTNWYDICPDQSGPPMYHGCSSQEEADKANVADDVVANPMVFAGRGGLSLSGSFTAEPISKAFAPETLTVWLPTRMSLLDGSVKPCSEAKARGLGRGNGCTQVAGGRLRDDRFTAWFAFAGPKRNHKRHVWLKVRDDNLDESGDTYLAGFGTGVIQKASGAFATKIVLRMGSLGIRTGVMELLLGKLRASGDCPAGGWRYRVKLEAAEGTADRTGRSPCNGSSGRGGR